MVEFLARLIACAREALGPGLLVFKKASKIVGLRIGMVEKILVPWFQRNYLA